MTRTTDQIDTEKARKPRPDLIPASALLAVGRCMGYGYHKHGDCTWTREGTEQAKPETHLASAMRHLLEHLADPDATEEGSGLPVLWHCAAQVLIAIECTMAQKPDLIRGRITQPRCDDVLAQGTAWLDASEHEPQSHRSRVFYAAADAHASGDELSPPDEPEPAPEHSNAPPLR